MVNVLGVKQATGGLLVAGPAAVVYNAAVIGIIMLLLVAALILIGAMSGPLEKALAAQEHDQSLLGINSL
jgi:hypothetical protein